MAWKKEGYDAIAEIEQVISDATDELSLSARRREARGRVMATRQEAARWLTEYLLSGAHRGCTTETMMDAFLSLVAPEAGEAAEITPGIDGLLVRLIMLDPVGATGREAMRQAKAAFAAERERADKAEVLVSRLRAMSTVEMMCENENVKCHVEEWERRTIKAEAEVAALKSKQCGHGWRGYAPENGDRIVTPCPSCGMKSLFIGTGGHLTCGNLGPSCQNPAVGDCVDAIKAERNALAAAIERVKALPHYLLRDDNGNLSYYVLGRAINAALAPVGEATVERRVKQLEPGLDGRYARWTRWKDGHATTLHADERKATKIEDKAGTGAASAGTPSVTASDARLAASTSATYTGEERRKVRSHMNYSGKLYYAGWVPNRRKGGA